MPVATVELLYFPDCPNVPVARERLRRAFDALGAEPTWTEVDVSSDAAPVHARGYSSPSILVDGKDVTGATPGGGSACSVYVESDVHGVPPLEAIVAALRASAPSPSPTSGAAVSSLAAVPGALLSVLPVVSCPSCWPAYAGILSSMGVPFLMDASWLLPITAAALVAALGGLAFRARQRHGFGPLVLGAVAAGAILVGKFVLGVDGAVYAGTGLLVGAGLWNGWPARSSSTCATCDAPIRAQA
jgi:hypothetical protein